MGTLKEYLPMFIVVVLAVIAAAYISGKLKLNSYEEYYEENFDTAGYREINHNEFDQVYRRAA